VELQPGDILVAFTDGISEAMNASDEEWGEDRLIACVHATTDLKAEGLLRHTIQAADMFVAGHKQHDDMTIIVGVIL
jgi:serine phosphatase RsbU (regulator of sigma subunit)